MNAILKGAISMTRLIKMSGRPKISDQGLKNATTIEMTINEIAPTVLDKLKKKIAHKLNNKIKILRMKYMAYPPFECALEHPKR